MLPGLVALVALVTLAASIAVLMRRQAHVRLRPAGQPAAYR